MTKKMIMFWFRRDLRLDDNHGLFQALAAAKAHSKTEPQAQVRVQPLFIFDTEILDLLEDRADARVHFLHETLSDLKKELRAAGGDLWVHHGKPLSIWKDLVAEKSIQAVYTNHDYEPAARKRDEEIAKFLGKHDIEFKTFKDQALFEKDEILTDAGKPYSVFTPYKRKVLTKLTAEHLKAHPSNALLEFLHPTKSTQEFPSLKSLGFEPTSIPWPPAKVSSKIIKTYDKTRNFPALEDGTTRLGLHLRFGTLSIRALAREAMKLNDTWMSELIWRDFFMQVLWHYPDVETKSYREDFEKVAWRKSKKDFERWSQGQTGYPMVDAGMRELNTTGFMHNRVRMLVASFLTKHLLIHWYEGERYFAKKLLDYDLAANNGNWQWAAGTGCDAAPYFRIFNPATQAKKFDPDGEYVRRWVPEAGTSKYVKPMVDHNEARGRALSEFSLALKGTRK